MDIKQLEKIFIKIIKKEPMNDLKSNLNNYTNDMLNAIYAKYGYVFKSFVNL